jgi:NADH:ubiquinone oxidoreductase subunit F (NADH-binding)/(2Fe-2S) ferredoxin/NAD-dependent dihydropyrimidine dehydrogenase PreA subunit
MADTINFYTALQQFMGARREQSGLQSKILVQVGSATCEKAAGSDDVLKELTKLIRNSGRSDILIRKTGCTSRCAREPIMSVFRPGEFTIKYEKVDTERVRRIFHEHIVGGQLIPEYVLDKRTDTRYEFIITVCSADTCRHGEPHETGLEPEAMVRDALKEAGAAEGKVRVFSGSCFGICRGDKLGHQHVMMIYPEKVLYCFGSKEELREIVDSHIVKHTPLKKYETHADFITEQFIAAYGDVSFFNKQTRLTLRNCGLIDPESLVDYVMNKGYEALAKVLDKGDPDWVVDEIYRSGLRGRGGGGYLTGQKWKNAKMQKDAEVRYVVCNADEGDPGAFMDRSAIEGDPFIIVEGMTIGGFAVGAHKGYIYVRAEYPLAIKRLEQAIATARENNLLGKNIMNSNFNFDLEIRLGAGAFVCGEETALIMSIEGKRGQPVFRPPYPTTAGLWGCPTVINNVETWANVPTIMLNGADWFSRIGTKTSKGTKVFALAGKVENTGLIEVPMGTTLRDIIFDIGGGIPNGRKLKSIQTGGPSGGCIPASKLDTPVDYEELKALGSIMGSGGMIVLDDTDCMVSTAKFFLEFTQDESCGKCVPCREGTLRMLEIMERITSGEGVMEDIDKLQRLGRLIQKSSLCGLGISAPNPILSAIENFREEFLTHILEKRCPTHKCTKLIRYEIDADKCTGCTLCGRRCPVFCISGQKRQLHVINQVQCIKCGACFEACKFDAVKKV